MLNNKFSFFSIPARYSFFLKSLLIFVTAVYFISCRRQAKTVGGFSLNDEGIYLKYCAIGEDETPDENQWLLLNVKYKTQRDSIFYVSNHHGWKGHFIKCKEIKNKPLLKIIYNMAEGDSINAWVNPTIFFNEIFDIGSPSFTNGDSIVKLEMKLVAIMEEDEKKVYEESKYLDCERLKKDEQNSMIKYAQKNFVRYETLEGNILFKKIKITKDSLVTKGKLISIKYRGSFTDNLIFDQSAYFKPIDFTYGSEGQLLPGLQIVLKHLRKGEVAKFILPSRLAFGEEGSSDGFIPPHTPLVYEIEVVNIKQ